MGQTKVHGSGSARLCGLDRSSDNPALKQNQDFAGPWCFGERKVMDFFNQKHPNGRLLISYLLYFCFRHHEANKQDQRVEEHILLLCVLTLRNYINCLKHIRHWWYRYRLHISLVTFANFGAPPLGHSTFLSISSSLPQFVREHPVAMDEFVDARQTTSLTLDQDEDRGQ